MQQRQAISAFLRHDGRLLLVRRSDRVGSFQGFWSGISGYLEGDPLIHALQEILEETSIPATDLTLIRQAKPVDIVDHNHVGVVWRIHPFLFELATPDKIKLDWENDELRWILPQELGHYKTVPGLDRILSACLMDQES
ncbi:MAG: NUDIX domain-containing protein [Magnetococcales bacterium]|nr:NUDIX domain-containing protein [Magnetococcales bacterium]